MTTIPVTPIAEPAISCSTCAACCCQLEVMLITDTGVPERFIDIDDWGGEVMRRLDDGWCAALDRDSMRCTIYELRPLICREFELGEADCLNERRGIATAYRWDGSERHRVVQGVAFYPIVGAADTGVGVVRGTDADLMPAVEAQAEADAVFELEG